MTPCSLVGGYQQFVATYPPHFTAKSAVQMIHNLRYYSTWMSIGVVKLKLQSPVRYLNVFYTVTVHI